MTRNYSIRILRIVCGAIIYVMICVMLVAYFFKHMVDIDIDDALDWTEENLREMVYRIKKLNLREMVHRIKKLNLREMVHRIKKLKGGKK